MATDFSQIPSQFDDIPEGHPVVFISYSWDNSIHKAWVRKLSDDLRSKYSVYTLLDQYNRGGYDLISFMTKSISVADRVLLIGTPEYKRKSELYDKGGVKYEDQLISAELYHKIGSSKFIPILRKGKFDGSFSSLIETRTGYSMVEDNLYEETLHTLAADLWNNPINAAPALGPKPSFVSNLLLPKTETNQSVEQYVAEIKHLLSTPNSEIAYTEMIEAEGKATYDKIITKAQYNFVITPVIFQEYIVFHLSAVEKLIAASIVIVRYGTYKQQTLLVDEMVRLCMKTYDNNEITTVGTPAIHLFAASFLFHAIGISCVKYGYYQILPLMMTKMVPASNALSNTHDYSLSCLAGTIHWQPDVLNIYMDTSWSYPYSELISRRLKPFFKEYFLNGEQYSECFAIWEKLFSLMYVYYRSSPFRDIEVFPMGLFMSETIYRNVLVQRGLYYSFFNSAVTQKEEWEPIKQGLFDGDFAKFIAISEKAETFYKNNRRF